MERPTQSKSSAPTAGNEEGAGSCCGLREVVNRDPDYAEIENLNKIPTWLAPCHFAAAACQCTQSLFLFAFATQVDMKWCVYTNYPDAAANDAEETEIYAVPGPAQIGCFNTTWYAGAFILLSGFAHVLHNVPRIRQWYEHHMERHHSPMRWIEYSFSCSLMRIHIAQVAGVTDVFCVILIFMLTQSAMFLVMLHEVINAKNRADGYKQNWLPVICAMIPNFSTWGVIFAFYKADMAQFESQTTAAIIIVLFVLECTFPLIFFLQWMKVGIFKDYLMGEFGFIVMSFTTKTFLAWVTLAGANAFSKNF
jgi:Heliorhodopsin